MRVVKKYSSILMKRKPKNVFSNLNLVLILSVGCNYFFRTISGQDFDESFIGNSSHFNFLSERVLIDDPLSAIWSMHAQPPLLNSIYAMGYLFYPFEVVFVRICWLMLAISTPLLIFKTLINLSVPYKRSFTIAFIYSLYPNTTSYSFWSYNTILIQFLYAFLIFSFSQYHAKKKGSLVQISIALLMLSLGRAPFIPALCSLILLYLLINSSKSQPEIISRASQIIAITVIIFLSFFQFHLYSDFKQVTSGSLGGFSTLRVIRNGLTPEDLMDLRLSACEKEVLQDADNRILITDLPECVKHYSSLSLHIDETAIMGNQINSKESLMAAIAARETSLKVLMQKPTVLFRGVAGHGEKLGSLDYFLSNQTLKDRGLRRFIDNFPFALSCLSMLFILSQLIIRTEARSTLFVISLVTVNLFVLSFSLFTEILENERYKHEAFPLYFLLIGLASSYIRKVKP